jgi:hypothetical protein
LVRFSTPTGDFPHDPPQRRIYFYVASHHTVLCGSSHFLVLKRIPVARFMNSGNFQMDVRLSNLQLRNIPSL